MTIALRIDPEDQTVDPGRPAVYTIHVVNQSGVVDRVALDILGSAGDWSTTDPPAVALFPGTDATASVVITPPLGTPLGPVPLGVRATAETSGFVEVGEANLNVGASRTVEAELRPRTATGKRRASSVIVLHNLGNAPTKVSVVATDPDDAIVFDAPSAVQIGPGMVAELPLRMRLPSREKQGATLPYQVLVEGGDTGQSLDGQVRQPAKKRWPILAALMVVAMLALAFAYLRPEDAKPIAAGGADEPITTTVPGALTTVPVTTTAAPAAAVDPAAAAAAAGAAAGGPGGPAPGAPAPGAPPPGAAAPGTTLPPAGAPSIVRPQNQPPAPPTAICPGAKGTAQATAQRVACSWHTGGATFDGEIGRTMTPEAHKELSVIAKAASVQAAGVSTFSNNVSTVPFACPTNGTGVKSMLVQAAPGSAGLVFDVVPCTPSAISS